MPTLDGRKYAVDSVVHQHKSTGALSPDLIDDEIGDSLTVIGPIGYESVLLPLKPGRDLTPKLTRTVPPVWHSASSRSHGLVGKAVNQRGGARNALAHNMGGRTTRPTVSLLEGPGANGS